MGRHLSVVQHKATIILALIDSRDQGIAKAEDDFRRFREAIVASGHSKRELLFPEFFPSKKKEDVSEDYANVEWKMPSNAKEEYESLMASIAANRNGSFGGDSLTDPDAGWR